MIVYDENGIYRNTRILITGGLGFIGSNLAIRLVELGGEVTLVDNLHPNHGGNIFNIEPIKDRVHWIKADIGDSDSIRALVPQQDFIFNLAGQTSHIDSMDDPLGDIAANCIAPVSLLDACRHLNPGVRIVYAGTRQVYGVPQRLPVDESHPLTPVDVNGCNKIAAENYHQVYYRAYGLRSSILRLTNTFGPRMRIMDARQNVLGFWIGETLCGKKISIFGDGQQQRDFNYVDDVVDALLRCAGTESAVGEAINLGGQTPWPLGEVAELLCRTAGQGGTEYIHFPEERKAIDIGHFWLDAQKAKDLLNWYPRVTLEQGLATTLEYFDANLRVYRPES